MLRTIAPKEYINQPDILNAAGEYIGKYGRNVLILGSEKSIEVTQESLFLSLKEAGISYFLEYFTGYPTFEKARLYASQYENRIDAVVGVGGGRVIDTAKTLGNLLDVPVVAIPTIAATCAAWAAISVLYDNEGRFTEVFQNQKSPVLILADTRILINAPVRYTYAGVIDTFAKWYELNVYADKAKTDTTFQVISDVSQLAFRLLVEHAHKALEEAKKGTVAEAAAQTIDAIIYLAGLAGSLKSDQPYVGIAHVFYNLSTQVVNAPQLLHGEKIAFGLIFQQILLQQKETEIDNSIRLFAGYDNLFTLSNFGITQLSKNKIADISELINGAFKSYSLLQKYADSKKIETAIYETNNMIEAAKQLN